MLISREATTKLIKKFLITLFKTTVLGGGRWGVRSQIMILFEVNSIFGVAIAFVLTEFASILTKIVRSSEIVSYGISVFLTYSA